jgi:nucleotide-binding universal stress UspA family protein
MRIVLAVDLSSLSEVVVNDVAARPWPRGTIVHVVHVVDSLAFVTATSRARRAIWAEEDRALVLANSVAERLQLRGLETTTQVVEGYPGTAIVDCAEQWNADFVVVGSHGHSGIMEFLVGSTAKCVLQNAPCSVEIVRASGAVGADFERAAMKIILATDGSEYSIAAAQSIAERPWPPRSQIKIVGVVDSALPATEPWYAADEVIHSAREEKMRLSREAVSAGEGIISETGLNTVIEVLEGNPKRQIMDEAKRWGADLVVVGSHGHRGFRRALLGSVSEAVAMHAHCTVDLIRDRALLGRDRNSGSRN